jgi:hypothetical protein
MRVEILRGRRPSPTAELMLRAIAAAARAGGAKVTETHRFAGQSDVLVLFGVGADAHNAARRRHVKAGGHVLMFDLGYFGPRKGAGFLRASVDRDHPQHLLDRTPPDPSRWLAQGIALREDADPQGVVLLVGLGAKSRNYLLEADWEQRALASIHQRFPDRTVLHRPKPHHEFPKLKCERDLDTPIDVLLRRSSLVVCRHSNVAIDAAIAGVPFETEDGAAAWLAQRPFTPENRLDFLQRLAWWQWRNEEAGPAWAFLKGFVT